MGLLTIIADDRCKFEFELKNTMRVSSGWINRKQFDILLNGNKCVEFNKRPIGPPCLAIDAIIIHRMTPAHIIWINNENTDFIGVDGISNNDSLNKSTKLNVKHANQPE